MQEQKSYELSHEDLQKVMVTIDIPVCPLVVTEAMKESQKDEPDLKRLADLVANDAGLSAAALKLANSALYGNGSKISSVRKAVERLGTKNVVCVIVSVALRNTVSDLPTEWLDEFWKRTTLLAVAASMIARPGMVVMWGAISRKSRPVATIRPQEAVGGWTPSPRNDSAASTRMAFAM